MALNSFIRLGTFVLIFCFGSFCAYATSMDEYQKRLEHVQILHKKIVEQNKDIQVVQEKLNNKGFEISKLKEQENSGFLQKINLQKKMQEAQSLSVELDALYNKRSTSEDQLSAYQKSLLRSIESDLSKAHLHKRSYTQALMNLHQQVSKLDFKKQPSKKAQVSLDVNATENSSSLEQWVVLQDLQLYTQDLIDQTERELAYEKQQKILKKELSHLMNEEMFFGEQGFIQGTARKQNTATTAVSQNENTESDGQGDQTDPNEPVGPDEPVDPDEPIDPDEPVDPDVMGDTESLDDTASIDEQDIDTPDLGFDEIDPKVQSLMMDSVFPEVAIQESPKGVLSEQLEVEVDQRNKFFENPNEITNAILALTPQSGESKEAFLMRKVEYLNDILSKLKLSSKKVQAEIESMQNAN